MVRQTAIPDGSFQNYTGVPPNLIDGIRATASRGTAERSTLARPASAGGVPGGSLPGRRGFPHARERSFGLLASPPSPGTPERKRTAMHEQSCIPLSPARAYARAMALSTLLDEPDAARLREAIAVLDDAQVGAESEAA